MSQDLRFLHDGTGHSLLEEGRCATLSSVRWTPHDNAFMASPQIIEASPTPPTSCHNLLCLTNLQKSDVGISTAVLVHSRRVLEKLRGTHQK
jgi:hypothetical protein